MMKKIYFAMMIVFILFAMQVQTVQATPILTLSDGITTVTIADNFGGDSNPLPGVVTYSGPVGSNWIVNVSTGITWPFIGMTPILPEIELNSLDVTRLPIDSTLTIQFSQIFGPFSGVLTTDVGGTSPSVGTTQFDTLLGGSSISSLGPFGPGAFSGTATSAPQLFTSGTLTLDATIHHTGAGITSFDDHVYVNNYVNNNNNVKVPEPGIMLLFGSGLLALAGFRRAIKK